MRGHLNTDVRARGSNSQPLDPEFDTLDRSATDPPLGSVIIMLTVDGGVSLKFMDKVIHDNKEQYINKMIPLPPNFQAEFYQEMYAVYLRHSCCQHWPF